MKILKNTMHLIIGIFIVILFLPIFLFCKIFGIKTNLTKWLDKYLPITEDHYENLASYAQFTRNKYNMMRAHTIKSIIYLLKDEEDNILDLLDYRGSLRVGGDDQESVMIMNVKLSPHSTNPDAPPNVMVGVGVFEEEYSVALEDYPFETILNVMDAMARAIKTE